MKHYLLTWYGITDLKSSLGLEASDGPILGALKTGNFTDVIILAYTNREKEQTAFTGDLYNEWKTWKTLPDKECPTLPYNKSQQYIDAVSNTETGHNFYAEWLKDELTTAGITVNIKIIPKELKHLNDTDGIFRAASSALKLALNDISEKNITTFISPGTPVMAYTWALIARANPQFNIGVISSSDQRKPPEKIDLPKELLMPITVTQQTIKPSKYDTIFHLLGRERMPVYFGIQQFQAKLHIFITTQEYESGAADLSSLLPQGSQSKTILIKDPFKPADTRKAIEEEIASSPDNKAIAVNLTGGTKIMFAGALSACWQHELEPFYFEINHHNIIFIRDGSTIPFTGVKSVEDFFAVNGFDVVKHGRWEDISIRQERLNVTQKLWDLKEIIRDLYKNNDEFQKYSIRWGVKPDPPFSWSWKNSYAKFDNNSKATLVLEGESILVPKCYDFGKYLGGGWFEEYIFNLLRVLEEKGHIHDLRIGLEVNHSHLNDIRKPPIGEFDCAFTDGKRLWLVECKAGVIKQEHIQKLENNLKTYGGIAAKGLFVSAFPIGSAHTKRISSSTSIKVVQSKELEDDAFLKTFFS